ncbi:hypothetical protein L195_g061453, partial [Trifolium pratense]
IATTPRARSTTPRVVASLYTMPRVKLHHAARDQGRGESDIQYKYYAARDSHHAAGVVDFLLHAARDTSHAARD